MGEVVVYERLDKQCVHAPFAPSRKRPLVVCKRPDHPVPRRGQYDDGGSCTPLAVPSSDSVAVGNVIVGPTPQSSFPEFFGERKTVGLMSPSPNALSIPEAGEGWFMIGIMVRVMRFQSLFKVIGITG